MSQVMNTINLLNRWLRIVIFINIRGVFRFFFKVTKFTKLWQHKVIVTESYICLWLGDRYHVICVTVCMSPIGWQFSRDLFNIVYMWHPLLLGRLSCCCHWQESLCFVCIRTNVYVLKFINKTWKTYLYIYQTTFNIRQNTANVRMTDLVFVSYDEEVLFTSVGGLEVVGSRCLF